MNNKRQMHFNELEQNHMSRFLTVYSSLHVKVHSFIIAKGIYCQARDDGGIKWANRRADWIHTFHSAWFWQMTQRQQQKEREKKKHPKFSKPTKKMGEELAANKRCQRTSGSSETEHKRKLKATLAARESVALRIRPLHNMPQKAQELQTASCSELQGRVDHRLDF